MNAVVAVALGMRRLTADSDYTSKPDGRPHVGATLVVARSQEMPVQGPSERVLLSGTRLPASSGGGGYSTSEGERTER